MGRLWHAAVSTLITAGLVFTSTPSHADAATTPLLNEINCEGTDWIEVVNPTSEAIDLGGWSLTDDPDPVRPDHVYTYPSGTIVPASGRLVVERSAQGLTFGLSCGSDTVRLRDLTGTATDLQALPISDPGGGTWGRLPDGGATWTWTAPTPGAANSPRPPVDAPDDTWLFNPQNVVTVDFTVSQADLDRLAADPRSYVDATMAISDTSHASTNLPVGLRLKGSGSFRTLAGKSAFKISLTHQVPGQRLEGLKSLTLNNMLHDTSMIAEALTSTTLRDLGIAAPRVGYAFVRVNGAPYGLYANVETIDSVFAARWFASTQHVLENPTAGFDLVESNVDGFDVDEGSDTDLRDLRALIDAASSPSTEWWDRMSAVADMDALVRMWAAEHLLGHWDGYSLGANNYYLHSDTAGRFTMIPSGTDQTWKQATDMGQYGSPVLLRSCTDVAACRAAYVAAVAALADAWDATAISQRAESYAAAIRPWQALDPRKEYGQGDIDAAVASARTFALNRGLQARNWLANPVFTWPQPSGGGAPGGGGASSGSEPATPLAVTPLTEDAPAAPAAEPAPSPDPPAPAVAIVRGAGLPVPLAPLTSRVKDARRSVTAVGRAVRLVVDGLPPRTRQHLSIRIDGRWLVIGTSRSTRSGVARSMTLSFSVPGTYLVRSRAGGSLGYVWLTVRGLDAGVRR